MTPILEIDELVNEIVCNIYRISKYRNDFYLNYNHLFLIVCNHFSKTKNSQNINLRMDRLTNIKLRKSKAEIHLKPSAPKENPDQNSKLKICLICLRNESRYSCPKCQIWYCSSECYKSERHQDCSEDFYKGLVEETLRCVGFLSTYLKIIYLGRM